MPGGNPQPAVPCPEGCATHICEQVYQQYLENHAACAGDETCEAEQYVIYKAQLQSACST